MNLKIYLEIFQKQSIFYLIYHLCLLVAIIYIFNFNLDFITQFLDELIFFIGDYRVLLPNFNLYHPQYGVRLIMLTNYFRKLNDFKFTFY